VDGHDLQQAVEAAPGGKQVGHSPSPPSNNSGWPGLAGGAFSPRCR
jgi:hypothetical protein